MTLKQKPASLEQMIIPQNKSAKRSSRNRWMSRHRLPKALNCYWNWKHWTVIEISDIILFRMLFRIFLILKRRILMVRDITWEIQILFYLVLKLSYGKHSLRFLGAQLWAKLSKEERNIDTLAAFRKMIRKKDVTSIVEGCGTECRLCLA